MTDFSKIRCPKCKSNLKQNKGLTCGKCSTTYPIREGIPIMLPDLKSVDTEQDLEVEKDFYEKMFSDLKGYEDGHCIVYGQDRIYKFMEGLPRGTVLEAGCGGGHHSINLSKRDFKVTSIDLSFNGLNAAKKLAEHNKQDITFINADIKRLPFEDNEFDICFCSLILHHFIGLDQVVKELARVTRKVFVAYEVNAYDPISYVRFNVMNPLIGHPHISKNQRALFPKDLEKTLAKCGFNYISIKYDDVHDYLGKAPKSFKAKAIRSFQALMKVFPEKFYMNKFLLCAKR